MYKDAFVDFQGYNLITIVCKDSGINTMADLKGKKVAHTSAFSNSGNLAPRTLFPVKSIHGLSEYFCSGDHCISGGYSYSK